MGAILTAAVLAAGNLVNNDLQLHRTAKAWLYRSDDPQRKKVQDYGQGTETMPFWERKPAGSLLRFPPHPIPGMTTHVDWQESLTIRQAKPNEYIVYPTSIIFLVVCAWLIYRHAWLGAILAVNSELSPQDRQSARSAMPPLSLIFLILPIAMFILLLVITALRTVIHFPGWTFNIVAGFLILLPPLLIFRALGADVSGRIFPNR